MSTQARKRLLLSVAMLFAVNITLICVSKAEAAVYRQGSTGSVVRQIQQKLRTGAIQGQRGRIYGSKTVAAVKYFQRNNGLRVDGVCGPATLKAIGISADGATPYDNNLNLLARIISAEARGEPYVGQVAVGAVILNRMEHPSFPDTMAGVIYQPVPLPP
jgi:N-acetylmuramoyl-L-alanine amidase